MKHFQSVLLAAMAIIAGIAGNVVKCDHWYAAIVSWSLCGALAIVASIVGWVESIPKPHLVPIGYGKEDGRVDGLVFYNDGEPAYRVTPPHPTPLGSAQLTFDDPQITRLSTQGGKQIFPISVEDSSGSKINDLRAEMVLRGVDNVLVSFRYADARKPTVLRYTTVCKIEPTINGISISLERYRFAWWMLR